MTFKKDKLIKIIQLRDMVKSCTFRGVDCLQSIQGTGTLMAYDHFLTPKYGKMQRGFSFYY